MRVEVFFQRFLPTLSFFCFLKCLQLTQLLHLVGLLVGLLFSFELIFRGVICTHHSLRIISKGSVRFTLAAEWNTWVTRPALRSCFFSKWSWSHTLKCSKRWCCYLVVVSPTQLCSALVACHALHVHEGATKISLRQISRHSLKQTQPNITIIWYMTYLTIILWYVHKKTKQAISLGPASPDSRALVTIGDVKIWKHMKQTIGIVVQCFSILFFFLFQLCFAMFVKHSSCTPRWDWKQRRLSWAPSPSATKKVSNSTWSTLKWKKEFHPTSFEPTFFSRVFSVRRTNTYK